MFEKKGKNKKKTEFSRYIFKNSRNSKIRILEILEKFGEM